MLDTHVVIMAGGIGSRFWPLSTPEYPKQFIDVLGVGRTMIQMTVDRFSPMCPVENIWVVTSEKYLALVREQIKGIPEDNILAEPVARNTAPCIAYACWKIRNRIGRNVNIVVTPSDALVIDVEEYRRVIGEALAFTSDSSNIVTVGIEPTRPETGYGYICCEKGERAVNGNIRKVAQFKEKPDQETAEKYLAAGNYLWNAGIFVWNLETIVSAMEKYAPGIAAQMSKVRFGTKRERSDIEEFFPACDKISIDYAVMEKSPCIYTLPGDFSWSDLGTWGSLLQNSLKDSSGNAIITASSSVSLYDCRDSVVHISGLDKAVVQGLEGYIVAERDGKLLICRLSEEQRIKEFSSD